MKILPVGVEWFRADGHGEANTGMRRLTTFRSTTDRIYDGGPVRL